MSWQFNASKQPAPSSERNDTLSVASISESVFCPRAGILTLESCADERSEEPAFDVTAIYELQVLEAAIVRTIWWLAAGLVGAVILLFATQRIAQATHEVAWLLSLGFAGRLLMFLGRQVTSILRLLDKRQLAQKARCESPDPHSLELQDVTWWGMLNQGFESVQYSKAVVDPEMNIAGRPWRVLRYGSLRIPAFRTRSSADLPSQQSIAKIIAYCHLLEVGEGFDSPYGIVLMGDTYRGFAVPNRGTFQAIFVDAAGDFRRIATASEHQQSDPPPPTRQQKCSECPWGKPRLVSLGQPTTQHERPINPHVLRKWTKRYHCDCGDRFRWKPPHNENQGLREG